MPQKPTTAAILIIGNEILSGATQDTNTSFIARRLSLLGIQLTEVRVVRDDRPAIIEAVNILRNKHDFIFTTGGIGPTHDDITSECIAEAFGVAWTVHPEAKKRLEDYYRPKNTEVNEARLRMAKIPAGGVLIDNPVSAAPGYRIDNVFVLAGVPKIMQAMFDHVETMLPKGAPIFSRLVSTQKREADFAADLEAIQKEFPDIEIGSYPKLGISVDIVLRGRDEKRLDFAVEKVKSVI